MASLFADPRSAEVLARPFAISKSLWTALTVLTLVRLLFAASIPLTEDEAYYRLWAMHPGFGYFDHPPMTAWWIAIGRAVLGDGPLAARLVSIIASLGVSLLIVDLARLLGLSAQTGERAALWYNAALLIALGGAVITPDAPATFFWSLCLWCLARADRSPGASAWIAAGAAAGLACLSKYSALFIGPGALLWLASTPRGRRSLTRPGPWLALVTAALVFAPNLLWNATHHWLSFSKQFSRIAPSGFTPRHVLDFPATQFLLLNPLIAVFAVRGLIKTDWRGPEGRALALLPLTVAPFAAYLVLHSFHDGVQAHWPAPLYPTFALLAAVAASRVSSQGWRLAAKATPIVGFGLSALAFLHMMLPATDFGPKDPVMPLRGWTPFANAVEAERLRVGASWTGTFSYGTAAQLAAQNRTDAPILELIERARYNFMATPREPAGKGLVVELSRRLIPEDLTDCFQDVTALADIPRGDSGRSTTAYHAFLVARPKTALAAKGCREGKDRTPKPAAR